MLVSRGLLCGAVAPGLVCLSGCGVTLGPGEPGHGGGTSGNSTPTLMAITPASAPVGSPQLTLSLAGTAFLASSVAEWNGTPLATSFNTATSLTAVVPASDLSAAGSAQVTVENPEPGGGVSNAETFTIGNPVPVITSIALAAPSRTGATSMLVVEGSSFIPDSVVQLNGVALPTDYGNTMSLSTELPASAFTNGGGVQITVFNPAPGGGTSNVETLASSSVPTLASISPATAHAGSAATTLTLIGTNFNTASIVQWNGAPLATVDDSATTLTATIPASDLVNPGAAQVAVENPTPGGGTSNADTFTVAAGVNFQMIAVTANDLAWDSFDNTLYLSTPSSAENGNSIVPVNPITGAFGTPVIAGSEPNLLSVSATGQYLYVSLDGLNMEAVERLTLPDLQSDSTILLGSNFMQDPDFAIDLQAAPTADQTFAVIIGSLGASPDELGGVAIYDGVTPRPHPLCGFIQPNTNCVGGYGNEFDSLQWRPDASTMYLGISHSQDAFYTAQISASGFANLVLWNHCTATPCFRPQDERLHFDATTGYVYYDDGTVFDPTSGDLVGAFPAAGRMTPDGAAGLAYFLVENSANNTALLESFNIRTFAFISARELPSVAGTASRLIRWGASGLAFLTVPDRLSIYENPKYALYLIDDASFVGNTQASSAALSLPGQ